MKNGSPEGSLQKVQVGAPGSQVDFTAAAAEHLKGVVVSAFAPPAVGFGRVDTCPELSATILNNVPGWIQL